MPKQHLQSKQKSKPHLTQKCYQMMQPRLMQCPPIKKIKSMIANSLLKNNTNPKEEEANTEVKVMEAMAVTPASLETRVTTDKIRKEAGHNQDQELKTNQTHNHPSQKHATDVEKTIMINLIVGSKIKYVSTVTKWVT